MGYPVEGKSTSVAPAGFLATAAPVEGVDLGPVLRLDSPGRCPVCSHRVEERAVSCPGCLTDHHEECVQFNGACGVFGCGCGAPADTAQALVLEPLGGRSLLYSAPMAVFRSSLLSYVTLTVGALLGTMLAIDPSVLVLGMGLPTSYFLLAGTTIAWICQILLENIERSC